MWLIRQNFLGNRNHGKQFSWFQNIVGLSEIASHAGVILRTLFFPFEWWFEWWSDGEWWSVTCVIWTDGDGRFGFFFGSLFFFLVWFWVRMIWVIEIGVTKMPLDFFFFIYDALFGGVLLRGRNGRKWSLEMILICGILWPVGICIALLMLILFLFSLNKLINAFVCQEYYYIVNRMKTIFISWVFFGSDSSFLLLKKKILY